MTEARSSKNMSFGLSKITLQNISCYSSIRTNGALLLFVKKIATFLFTESYKLTSWAYYLCYLELSIKVIIALARALSLKLVALISHDQLEKCDALNSVTSFLLYHLKKYVIMTSSPILSENFYPRPAFARTIGLVFLIQIKIVTMTK